MGALGGRATDLHAARPGLRRPADPPFYDRTMIVLVLLACIPSAVVILIAGRAFLLMQHEQQQAVRIGKRRTCPRCGYDIRGLKEWRCPECGWDHAGWAADRARERQRLSGWDLLMVALVLPVILAVIAVVLCWKYL